MMSLYNSPELSDVKLIFTSDQIDEEINSCEMFAHKAILVNSGSRFFKACFLSEFKEKNQSELHIQTDDIQDDVSVLRTIYGDLPKFKTMGIEALLRLAIRYEFYGLEKCRKLVMDHIYLHITVDDFETIAEYHEAIDIDSQRFSELAEWFLLSDNTFKVLESLNKVDSALIDQVLLNLMETFTFVNTKTFKSFCDQNNWKVSNIQYYALSGQIVQRFNYLKDFNSTYTMVKLDPMIIYHLAAKYSRNEVLAKLDFTSMSLFQLKIIINTSQDVSIIKKIANIICDR